MYAFTLIPSLLLPLFTSFSLLTPILATTANGTENPCPEAFHIYCCPNIESSNFSPCEDRTLAEGNTLKDCLPEEVGHDFDKGYACCIADDTNIKDFACVATRDIGAAIEKGMDKVPTVEWIPAMPDDGGENLGQDDTMIQSRRTNHEVDNGK